jgi:hypothetical protein
MIREKENIVLIGMPASGKSTVGRILEKKLEKRLVDTDKVIEMRAHKSISRIFEDEGEAYFRGEGTLILNAGEVGFLNPINMDDKKVIVESGNYIINSEGVGISSPYATFSQTGGSIEINCKGEAVVGREIRLAGGKLTANGSVHATNKLTVSYTTLDITSTTAALISDKILSVNGVKLTSNGTELDAYAGETSIKTSPLSKARTTSMLFELIGMKNVPIAIDYVIFAVCLLAVAAIIVVPKLIKKKKLRIALEKYAAETAAKNAEKDRPAHHREKIDAAGAHRRDFAVGRHSRKNENGAHEQRQRHRPLKRLRQRDQTELAHERHFHPVDYKLHDLNQKPDRQHERKYEERERETREKRTENVLFYRLHLIFSRK